MMINGLVAFGSAFFGRVMLQKPVVPFWPVSVNEIVVLFMELLVATLRFDI